MRLKDKVAITTGAASGIGKATAILFAEHGAKVVVADIDETGANETVAAIRDAGNEATYVPTDVTMSDNTERMVAETVSRYGKLDILLNSAGIAMRLPVADLPEVDWHRCLDLTNNSCLSKSIGVELLIKILRVSISALKRRFRRCRKTTAVLLSTCPLSTVL